MVFAIHLHESAMGVHVSPILNRPPTAFPSHPSGLSQCTGFECPVSYIELGLVIYFTYGNIHVSCYSLKSSHPHLLPHNPKVCSLYLCLLLSRIQAHHCHLSKFHIYALIYCIGVFLSNFTLYNRFQFHPPH